MPLIKLRQQLRQRRRALSLREQNQAARTLAKQFSKHPRFIRSRAIAVYLASDGELSLQYLIEKAWQMGKRCYLPVLQAHKPSLWFLPYTPETTLKANRYGILEPLYQQRLVRPAWGLDLVLTPLVGFDSAGHRLGMGGGFYDRRFAHLQQQNPKYSPLIGVAHNCQQVEKLHSRAWDVPMSAIITDSRYIKAADALK